MSKFALSVLAFVSLISALPVPLDLLTPPREIRAEKGSVAATDDKGEPRWTADWTMEPWSVDGQRAVRFTETGRGIYSPYTTQVSWTLESIWRADERFAPLSSERTFRNSAGVVVGKESKTFDSAKGVVRFERSGGSGRTESRSLKAPRDTLTPEGIPGILRSLPFGSNRTFDAHLLTSEPKVYEIGFEPRGRERVRTPAGEFDCFKVELEPRLGLLNFAKVFIGKTYFWFSAEPPHFWVKYEGYENGRGTPRIRIELAKEGRPPQ